MSPCSPSEAMDARGEELPRRSGRSRWFANRRGARASEHGRSYRDRSGRPPPPSARYLRMADESHRGGPTVVDNRRARSSRPPLLRTPRWACIRSCVVAVAARNRQRRADLLECAKETNSVIVRRLRASDPRQREQAGPERPRCATPTSERFPAVREPRKCRSHR